MSVDLEPLLAKVEAAAPRFGRAADDLKALVSRGRAGDYKGVLQNARLVLEALLRSLVTDELKQTPGKAMLDDLVSKFRQQGNAGVVPTNVLAHMGTVQAWGNLSSHDHAGSLSDESVHVGPEEVLASLNSMLAILSWYSQKRGLGPALSPGQQGLTPVGTAAVAAPARPPGRGRAAVIAGVATVVAFLALGGWLVGRPEVPPQIVAPRGTAVAAVDFSALDAVYARREEPPPPAGCRSPAEAPQLVQNATDVDALALIDQPSPEAAYLRARARFEQTKAQDPALDVALRCEGFAAAHHLAGLFAVTEQRLGDAQASFEKARALSPGWLENRARLAGLLLKRDQPAAALAEIDQLLAARPDYAPAFFLRFAARMAAGQKDEALADLCRAHALGSEKAAEQVKALAVQCP